MYVPSLSAPAEQVMVPAGTAAGAAVRAAGLPTEGPHAIVIVRDPNSGLHDLEWAPEVDAQVQAVPASSPDGLVVVRHSAALVLAQAVQQLFPDAKLGLGAPTVDGFYYDFELQRPFSAEDLAVIEKQMKQIIAAGQRFTRRVIDSVDEARQVLVSEPYKQELLDLRETGNPRVGSGISAVDVAGVMATEGDLAIYITIAPNSGEQVWCDLSRGPHVPTTSAIPAVTLLRSEQVCWEGTERRQLQRIHGTACESPEVLADHLCLLDAVRARDHRELGRKLDLFTFPDEVGAGLPVFHPKGGVLRRQVEENSRRRHFEDGFEFVYTPHLSHASLIGGTRPLELYRDKIFPTMHFDAESDEGGTVLGKGRDYLLKPMNCPFHNLIYTSRERSHNDLPLRMFEMATIHRYEPVPVRGLLDSRATTMDDTHIFCTPEQLRDELRSLLASVVEVLSEYGFADLHLVLDTRNDEYFVGTDEQWAHATEALAAAGNAAGVRVTEAPAAAQFYGPQLNVHVVDSLGRSWKLSTLLVDFNLPKLDGLTYTSADGASRQPMMIHRSLFGSIERFVGLLTEHYAGAFPAWLAPVQVAVLARGSEQAAHLQEVTKALRSKDIRIEVDLSDASVPDKLAKHSAQLVPFVLLAGDGDATVSVVFRNGHRADGVPVATAVDAIDSWISKRVNAQPTAETVL
ncbi:threonine--tRNA ligase [Micromonospora qiuiae]|uniref:Threonine--tRNA ligase n=1 Tax=Micromonospora qiuiae TaxID=502268 RepID=A0ABQ4JFP8_9ACTN|nr:threonine--tRNA ligase [Micromonospora qiuiae]GIJ29209.1 threonine--tRNA ligase [Micromonospora qiuiae]